MVPDGVSELDDRVYSIADVDVAPPTLLTAPMLERWRAAGAAESIVIEVVIAQDGTVERVQLLSNSQLQDMMVLSGVKAWIFEPAYRAGVPVRYRLFLAPRGSSY